MCRRAGDHGLPMVCGSMDNDLLDRPAQSRDYRWNKVVKGALSFGEAEAARGGFFC